MSRFGGEMDASFSSMASSFKRPRTDYEYGGGELGLSDYYREIPSHVYATRDRIPPSLLLPPDASNTLFVKGLPTDCSRREVGHIFRPFRGFKDVRLVSKDFPRGDTLVFCFVEFDSPTFAATALGALQGYKLELNDRNSPILEIEFGKSGSGSASAHRGRRGITSRSYSPPYHRRR